MIGVFGVRPSQFVNEIPIPWKKGVIKKIK